MRMKVKIIFGCFFSFFLAGIIVLPLGGCGNNAKPLSQPSPVIGPDPMKQAGLGVYWERQLKLAPNERIKETHLLDENLYFITNQKALIAMDARSGVTKWRVPITHKPEKVFAPIHFDGIRLPKQIGTVDDITNPPLPSTLPEFDAVIINTLTSVLVINRTSGEVIRDIRFQGFSATNRGATDGERYYVAGNDKQIYAVMLLPAVNIWAKDLGERVLAPMVCVEETLFVGTVEGGFYCFYADNNGAEQWEVKLDGQITTPFAIEAGRAYIACQDGRIYAFGAARGQKNWQPLSINGTPGGPLLIAESTIFEYSRGGGISAVNIANGKLRWNIPTGRDILAVMDDNVYVIDTDKNLQVANAITGKISQTIPMKKNKFFATNINAPAIYAATSKGEVCCIRKLGAARLTVEMLK